MRGLAGGNNHDSPIRFQVKEILKYAQHTAFAIHMPLKGAINAGLGESVLEEMARGDPHVESKALAIRRHGRILYERWERLGVGVFG